MYKLQDELGTHVLIKGECISFTNLSPLWQEYQQWLAQGNIPEPQYTPDEAMSKMVADINEYAHQLLSMPWYYPPADSMMVYEIDITNKAQSATVVKSKNWKTAEKDETGVKAKTVSMSDKDVQDYNDATVDRAENFEIARDNHTESVQDMFIAGESADAILAYDFTRNWPEDAKEKN